MASDLGPGPIKGIEPKGNMPERSVDAPKVLWWILAAVVIGLFCLLAWLMHGGGFGGA